MEAVVDYYRENDLSYRAIPDGEVILDTTHNREQVVAPNRSLAPTLKSATSVSGPD